MRLHHTALWTTTLLTAALAQPAAAVPIPDQGDWITTLKSRDINGDGAIDAWYDSVQNQTYLNAAPVLTYSAGESYLAMLDVYGVTGWSWANVATMYSSRLGNSDTMPNAGWTNTGPFSFVENGGTGSRSGWYWRGTGTDPVEGAPGAFTSHVFAADGTGVFDYQQDVTSSYGVWAMRAGDVRNVVSAVPEPSTWMMSLAGLAAVLVVRRKRAQAGSR